MTALQLKRNRVKCLSCGEILESYSRWDYKTCDCPQKTMVDGGLEYERYGGVDLDLVETMFEYVEKGVFLWGVLTPEGLVRKPLDEIEDTHLQNIALHLRTRYDMARFSDEQIKAATDEQIDYIYARHGGDLEILEDDILPELKVRGLEEVTEEIPH